MAKKQCLCVRVCVRAGACVWERKSCTQGSCPEGPHLPQVKQEIQAPSRFPTPLGGPATRGTGWVPRRLPHFILSPPLGGWHLLPHSADEELRPRDPETGCRSQP